MVLSSIFVDGVTKGQLTRYGLMAAAKARLVPQGRRYDLGLVDRPQYAYGLGKAAAEAIALGYKAMTAIEFGVAGGNGLLALEEHASVIERRYGISITVVGFDTGAGLPPPTDYRDAPFLWDAGDFEMDEEQLRARLSRADLVLGDVRETAAAYVKRLGHESPIGFVAFDLDFWSSTIAALDIFRGPSEACMPRVWCYFDDVVGMIDDIGVPLAIAQFNEESTTRRLRQPWNLRQAVPFRPAWVDQMYQFHIFDHPRYGQMVAGRADRVLPLKE
jgi:hypothetical protein